MTRVNLGPARKIDLPEAKKPPKGEKPPKPPKPPKPEKPPKDDPPAPTVSGVGAPTGLVSGAPANNGIPWSQINQYDASYAKWGEEFGIDPGLCKAMTVVESGGVDLHGGQPGSTGILQIMPRYWSDTAARLGVSLFTPDGQIAVCNAILSGHSGHGDYGSWEQNFRRLYFPGDDPASGVTQNAYVDWIKKGAAIIAAALKPGPKPDPKPTPPLDPIRVIVGGDYPPITYGFRADEGLALYSFGVGHGTTAITMHTGDDVPVPRGTKLFTPMDGLVRCVGYSGTPDWGQSCGAYEDTQGGVGNITILLDGEYEGSQIKLTLGHCSKALVKPGDRVRAGQEVGVSGSNNGDHVHVETSIYAPEKVDKRGNYPTLPYFLVDPVVSLSAAMGGKPPLDVVPYNLWADNGNIYAVTAKRDLTAYQRADPQAEPLITIAAGTTFNAVARVIGQDAKEWWLAADLSRVPTDGTTFTPVVR